MEKEQILKIEKEVVERVLELSTNEDYLRKITDKDHPEKINPFVVALLVGDKGNIVSYRSELFDGDHAEFNLFMQKLDGEDHSNDTLFVSLEPCNHDSRLSTISCSELIVKAGIRKVYIGTLDPDKLVRGDGYAYLVANHVDVDFFEEHLYAQLIEINKRFYLSKISDNEDKKRFFNKYIENFDKKSIAFFLGSTEGNYYATLFEGSFEEDQNYFDKLINEYLKENKEIEDKFYKVSSEEKYFFSNVINLKRDFYIDKGFQIAFYKTPNIVARGSCIKIIDNTEKEIKSVCFNNSMFISIVESYFYVKKILSKTISKNLFDVELLFREMLVNAVCHKNYDSFSPIIIKIFLDRIEIFNPVDAAKINIDYLNKFKMPTNPINGCLTDIAISMRLMEGQGRGSETFSLYLKKLSIKDLKPYELICDILKTTIPFESGNE